MTTILISPARSDAELASELKRLGARVIRWAETSVTETHNNAALDEAIENLFGYDWLLFKNPFSAEYFLRRFQLQRAADELDTLRILTVGGATEQKLVDASIHVDIALNRFSLSNAVDALKSYTGEQDSLAGLNVLIPSANITRERFELQLEDAGARVDNVAAYRTTLDKERLAQMNALLLGGGIDRIVFTSPATSADFARLVDTDDLPRILADVAIVCSDPQTKAAATQFGLAPSIISPPRAAALLASLTDASPAAEPSAS